MKAVSFDSGPPVLPLSASGGVPVEAQNGGDEHVKLLWPRGGVMAGMGAPHLPPLGALLRLQPGHCDPTVNLYDWMVAYRGQHVEAVWAVTARGPGS